MYDKSWLSLNNNKQTVWICPVETHHNKLIHDKYLSKLTQLKW